MIRRSILLFLEEVSCFTIISVVTNPILFYSGQGSRFLNHLNHENVRGTCWVTQLTNPPNPFSFMLFLHRSALPSVIKIPKEFSFPRKSIISETKHAIISHGSPLQSLSNRLRSRKHFLYQRWLRIEINNKNGVINFLIKNKMFRLLLQYFTFLSKSFKVRKLISIISIIYFISK